MLPCVPRCLNNMSTPHAKSSYVLGSLMLNMPVKYFSTIEFLFNESYDGICIMVTIARFSLLLIAKKEFPLPNIVLRIPNYELFPLI